MKEVLRIIENTEDDGMTKVITYLSPCDMGHEVGSRESFWDVVGDELLSDIVDCIITSKKKSGICCLIPGENQAEGEFYSAGILKALLKKVHQTENGIISCLMFLKEALIMGYLHWNGRVSWERRS